MTPPLHQLLAVAGLVVVTLYVCVGRPGPSGLAGTPPHTRQSSDATAEPDTETGTGRRHALVAAGVVLVTATYSAGVLGTGVAAAPVPSAFRWLLDWLVLTPLAVVAVAFVLLPRRPGTAAGARAPRRVVLDGVLVAEVDGADERAERVRWHVPVPSWRELVTLVGFPTAISVFHVVVQPRVAWGTFGYLKLSVARASGFTASTPVWAQEYGRLWHLATRFTHALVHTPDPGYGHLLFNASLVLAGGAVLFVLLDALDRRERFAPTYWGTVLVAPVVGSLAFDVYGTTPHGYGASTVAFALLGLVAGGGGLYCYRRALVARPRGEAPLRSDGGAVDAGDDVDTVAARADPIPRGAVLLFVTVVASVVAVDAVLVTASNPVHLAGFCLGLAVAVVSVRVEARR